MKTLIARVCTVLLVACVLAAGGRALPNQERVTSTVWGAWRRASLPSRRARAASDRIESIDRPTVGHREKERPERSPRAVEPLPALPQPQEHVLGYLVGTGGVARWLEDPSVPLGR